MRAELRRSKVQASIILMASIIPIVTLFRLGLATSASTSAGTSISTGTSTGIPVEVVLVLVVQSE